MKREFRRFGWSASGDPVAIRKTIETGDWDRAIVTFHTSAAAASSIELAPAGGPIGSGGFPINFAHAGALLNTPGGGDGTVIGVGPGCAIPTPLPSTLLVGISSSGGGTTTIGLTVELSREIEEEDHDRSPWMSVMKTLATEIREALRDVVIELRSAKR